MALGDYSEIRPSKATKLPMAALIALSSGLFVHSVIVTLLFPFAPVMVKLFGISDEKSGYYAGLLASAYFFGSLLAGPLWGCLSDVLGRKTVILIGLCGNAIFGIMFGFSVNLTMALGLRFILGLFCTVFIAAKTSLSELCDDSNQAQGFAVFGLCWALGIILGPVLGGVLAQPATKFPAFFSHHGIFGRFPFLLPSLVLAIMTVVVIGLCITCLPETLRWRLSPVEQMARTPRQSEDGGSSETMPGIVIVKEERTWRLADEEGKVESSKTYLLSKTEQKMAHEEVIYEEEEEDDPGFFQVVFCDPDTLMTGSIFCLCGFMPVAFDALFPMWSLETWGAGGLSFTTTNLGLAQAASGVSLVPMTLVIYPWLVNRFGAVIALQLSLITGVLQAGIPLVRLLADKTLVDLACVGIFAIRSFNMTGMASMFILTANSVRYPKYMGAVNGMLATVQNVVQAVAPTAVGALFAWSSSSGRSFPFDYHLSWLLLGGLHVLLLILTCLLPSHLNYRKS